MRTHRKTSGTFVAALGMTVSLLLLATCESPLLEEIREANALATSTEKPVVYTVTFDSQDAEVPADPEAVTVTPPATTISALPAQPQKTGYYFAGWFLEPEGAGSEFFSSTPVTTSFTVFANWDVRPVYTVTFDTDGGTLIDEQYIHAGYLATRPPDPERAGYTFSGWYKENTHENVWDFDTDTVQSPTSIHAKWAGNIYTVNLNKTGGEGGSDEVEVTFGSPMPPADAPTKEGFSFLGYFAEPEGDGTQYYNPAMESARNWDLSADNITLHAKWRVSTSAVSASGSHTVALKSDGTVWAWGWNNRGQLGDGTAIDHWIPVQVSGISNVAAIAAGGGHTLSLSGDSTVWAWGSNTSGELGNGTTVDSLTCVQVSELSSVIAIAAGSGHSMALKSDGTVWTWGWNEYGQLGDGTYTNRHTPIQVSGLSGVLAIAAVSNHSLALKSDGTVWAWGRNHDGELGDGTNEKRWVPVQVSSLSLVTAIAAGTFHSVALRNDGTVWAWGRNFNGQLGDGTYHESTTPIQVSGLSGIVDVAASNHTMALKSDGTVWAWGWNEHGQLGDNTNITRSTPDQVSELASVVAIATGNHSHSVALKSDGTVWAWGRNDKGQLGDGTNMNRWTPVVISGLL